MATAYGHGMITRRFITIAAAVAALGGATTFGGTAMATKGSCDPAPDPYNVQQMSKGNGEVFVELAYGWDGVSVFPYCVGPMVGARVSNTSVVNTWYAHLEGKKGKPVTIAIPPNSSRTYSASQLASVGLSTLADIAGLTLTLTP